MADESSGSSPPPTADGGSPPPTAEGGSPPPTAEGESSPAAAADGGSPPDPSSSGSPPEPDWRTDLRFGGWAGLTDEELLVDRGDERFKVAFDHVAQVTVDDYDYFLVILSVVLVGFGVWFARQQPLALVFSLAGLVSGYLVHRRRDRVVLHVRNRPKPVVLHPTEVTELQERLRIAIAPEEPKAVDQRR